MASTRRVKRVASSQPGFLNVKTSADSSEATGVKRKRVNRNKKKNWNKHSDINDVESFLNDVRHQERTTGGLLSEKSDESLFFLDIGEPKKAEQKAPETVWGKTRRGKPARPLRIDLILQHDSLVQPPKDVLAHQQPNAKKLRRTAQKSEHLVAKGVLPRRLKRLQRRRPVIEGPKKVVTEANNYPERGYYDIWDQETKDLGDPWYLQQTGKKRVKRPEKLNEKPSVLPAVEVIAAGGSYNPDFFSHQALLQKAHEVEVTKKKAEDKLERQLAVNKADTATLDTILQEEVEGLVEEDEEEEMAPVEEDDDDDDAVVGAINAGEKKTEKQRKKEKAEKIKDQLRLADRRETDQKQQLFQLRSIKASVKEQELCTEEKQKIRKANQEAEKSQPRRLGRLKFQPQDMEVQLSDELAGSLRQLKPEGSVAKDRFKSLQKRNLIEPRERAKFKRRLKLKYTEKRAFKAIT